MECSADSDDIIGIPAARRNIRVFYAQAMGAAQTRPNLEICDALVAAAATGGGAVVKIKLEAAERTASQTTASAAI